MSLIQKVKGKRMSFFNVAGNVAREGKMFMRKRKK